MKRIEEVFIPKIERNISLFEALYKVVPQLEDRIAKAIDDMRLILSFEVPFSVNTSRDFKTRATWYLAPDFGAAYVFGERTPADFVTFYGVQFHPFPINREVSYSLFRKEKWRFESRSRWATAFSINFGLTASNFTASSPEYKGVIGDKIGVMTGIGLRLTEMLRLNGGFLLTRREDPHPLRTDLVLHANPFVGVTLDVDLVKYIQDLGTRRMQRIITEQ
ncbi:MAG: hypothetical protein IPP26_11910 [Flavobacteriales bacterium]|nr:hypothetical protein [Flavobacteriales bacterium]